MRDDDYVRRVREEKREKNKLKINNFYLILKY